MADADFIIKNKSASFNYSDAKTPIIRWNDDDMAHDGKLYDITLVKTSDKSKK